MNIVVFCSFFLSFSLSLGCASNDFNQLKLLLFFFAFGCIDAFSIMLSLFVFILFIVIFDVRPFICFCSFF